MHFVKKKYKYRFVLVFIFVSVCATSSFSQYLLDWAQTYGGNARDEAYCIAENAQGNLILAGYSKMKEKHLWVVCIDEHGEPVWGKTFKAKPISEARAVTIMRNSNIAVAGFSVKDFLKQRELWVLKLSKEGELLWDKNFGGDGDESAFGITETYDGGFAIAGFSSTNGDRHNDAWILKLDSLGNKVWERFYGLSGSDFAYAIAENSKNELMFCGYQSKRADSHMAFWVAKVDSLGNDIWETVVQFNKWDVATSIVEGLDGFIYVVGYTRASSIIDYDIAIAKLDQEGSLVWKKTISWGKRDQATSVSTTYDNGIVISGFSRSGKEMSADFVVTKIDENGSVLWQKIFARKSLDYPNGIIETIDNGLAVAGTTYTQGGGWDFALLKFKNVNQPSINFMQDSVATSNKEKYELKSCIKTKSNLKNIQVYFNDSLIINNANKSIKINVTNDDCNIPVDISINLLKGLNRVKLIITDFKNHQIENECKVYFIPPSEVIW